MSLSEWLLAQFAEDEAVARAAEPGPWHVVSQYGDASLRYGDPDARGLGIAHASWEYDDERSPADFAHMARWNPARVLAGLERDRRIVELHRSWDSRRELDYCDTCAVWDEAGYEGPPAVEWPCPTLRTLALPYADHPDYREEWAL